MNIADTLCGKAGHTSFDNPVITVHTGKWYCLYIITNHFVPKLLELTFEQLGLGFKGTAWCDHAVNPLAVCNFATHNNFEIDEASLGLICARWYNDYTDYDMISENESEHTLGGRCCFCNKQFAICECEK